MNVELYVFNESTHSIFQSQCIIQKKINLIFQRERSGEGSGLGTPGTRTSSVLPDLLSQASPATPPRHDKSSSEEVGYYVQLYKTIYLGNLF